MKNVIKIVSMFLLLIALGDTMHAMSKDAPEFVPSAPKKEWVQEQLANLIWTEIFHPHQLQQALTQYNTKQLEGIIDELIRIWQTPVETLRFIKSLNIGEDQFNVLFVKFREKLLKAINSQQTKQLGSAIPKVLQSEEEQIRRAIELSLQEQEKKKHELPKKIEANGPKFLYSNQSNQLVDIWIPNGKNSWYPITLAPGQDFDKPISTETEKALNSSDLILYTTAGQFNFNLAGNTIQLSKKGLRGNDIVYDRIKTVNAQNFSIIINPDGSINLSERKVE